MGGWGGHIIFHTTVLPLDLESSAERGGPAAHYDASRLRFVRDTRISFRSTPQYSYNLSLAHSGLGIPPISSLISSPSRHQQCACGFLEKCTTSFCHTISASQPEGCGMFEPEGRAENIQFALPSQTKYLLL